MTDPAAKPLVRQSLVAGPMAILTFQLWRFMLLALGCSALVGLPALLATTAWIARLVTRPDHPDLLLHPAVLPGSLALFFLVGCLALNTLVWAMTREARMEPWTVGRALRQGAVRLPATLPIYLLVALPLPVALRWGPLWSVLLVLPALPVAIALLGGAPGAVVADDEGFIRAIVNSCRASTERLVRLTLAVLGNLVQALAYSFYALLLLVPLADGIRLWPVGLAYMSLLLVGTAFLAVGGATLAFFHYLREPAGQGGRLRELSRAFE